MRGGASESKALDLASHRSVGSHRCFFSLQLQRVHQARPTVRRRQDAGDAPQQKIPVIHTMAYTTYITRKARTN